MTPSLLQLQAVKTQGTKAAPMMTWRPSVKHVDDLQSLKRSHPLLYQVILTNPLTQPTQRQRATSLPKTNPLKQTPNHRRHYAAEPDTVLQLSIRQVRQRRDCEVEAPRQGVHTARLFAHDHLSS